MNEVLIWLLVSLGCLLWSLTWFGARDWDFTGRHGLNAPFGALMVVSGIVVIVSASVIFAAGVGTML